MPTKSRKESAIASNVSPPRQNATPPTSRGGNAVKLSVMAPKLNAMQTAELLRPFWGELLQNNLKNVKKFIRENRSKIDFNTARYTPCADGTGLHLCAQHGFIDCAKVLLDVGVKIDLQNKVGSTALHVACKFNQEEMVTFLLETGARMDIPDMRNNAAFDVAPYTLVDNCMLAPQRDKLAAEQQVEAGLLEIHEAAVHHFEEATLAKAHASMLLIDWESRSWEEWQVMQATNKLDREWSERVQESRSLFEIKQAMYMEQQILLQKEQDQIVQMWKNIFNAAQHRQQRAQEEMEQWLMMTDETEQHWLREQQELRDQCGLIETAHEFPNDADVQHWVLSTIIAMIDEAESGCIPVNPHEDFVTTDINELLVRKEIISVISNVLLRFPTVRDLQFSAIQCCVRLVRHCLGASQFDCSPDSTGTNPRASNFLKSLIKTNIMVLCKVVLAHFSEDLELLYLVIELLFHLLRFRGENGAHSLQFCQSRLSHQLPLQILRLHEALLPLQDHLESSHVINTSPEVILAARHHTAFFLFTLTKYSIRKTLDKDGALPLVRRLLFDLTKSTDIGMELTASTIRYLLGSLALLYSPPSTRQNSNEASPQPDSPASWSVGDLSDLLDTLRPWLSACSATSSDREPSCNAHRSLAFWTIKLLRNLTQGAGVDVVQLRACLRGRETFNLFADITLAIREHHQQESDDTAVQNIVAVWLELVEDVWLCRYNSDGQLAATVAFTLEFLLRQLDLEAQLADSLEGCSAFTNIAALFKLFALVLSNSKNMRFLVDHEYKIDGATRTTLQMLLGREAHQDTQMLGGAQEASNLELLAHILRVYLRFFDYERDHVKSGVDLHERCRAIGICAALHAFGLPDNENGSKISKTVPPIVNANQTDDQSTEMTANSKVKSKMQLARQWSRSTGEQQSIHSPELETTCALTRALRRHTPCTCYFDS